MRSITFNVDNVVNGWFQENFHKLSACRYVKTVNGLQDFSCIYRLRLDGEITTFVLEKE